MWVKPPESLSLKKGIVHVWKVNLESPAHPLVFYDTILSAEERERADRFYFEKDKNHYTVGRASLRLLVGRYLSLDPASIQFELSEFGKPGYPNSSDLQFNISHSGGLALMGFTVQSEIGVDLEKINPEIEIQKIASRFFAPSEQEEILQLPITQQAAAFYRCWTSKEAFIKAHGQGLSLPLDQFEVEVHPEKPAALKAVHWDPKLAEWDLQGLLPGHGYLGALACRRAIEEIHYFTLS